MAKPQSQISSIDDEPVAQETAVEAAKEAAVLTGANSDDQLSGKTEMLTIHSSNDDGGADAVFVSLNGYAYQIPRDKPFKVPTEVAQLLRDAKVVNYKPSGREGGVREDVRSRFAFSSQPA